MQGEANMSKFFFSDLSHLKDRAKDSQSIMHIPEDIYTRKARIAYTLFMLDRIRRQGFNFFGRFTNMIPEFAGILIILSGIGIKPTAYVIVLIVILMQVASFIVGYFYIKAELDKIETVIDIERVPFQKEVYELKKNRRKL